MTARDPSIIDNSSTRAAAGLLPGVAAYVMWGFLPLLFHAVDAAGSVTVVADRMLWSLLFVGIIVVATRRLPEMLAALRQPRVVGRMLVSSLLLGGNWLLYIWAVETGQVLEGSFGYFITPLINVAIGMVFLGERQNLVQGIAIGIAAVALVIQALGIGHFPFVALGLALTFGLYGFFRKQAPVASTAGLFIETLLLAPLAAIYLIWSFVHQGGIGVHGDPHMLFLLMLTGPATAVPLLMFAFAVQRLRMTTVGMLQYISPSLQFLLAVFLFREPMNAVQLVSFAIIWLSLAIFSMDSVVRRRRLAAAV